ncbi:oligo-1,6-glucosidase [Bacillus sp. FJAT-27916]|uniref:glycoside hydrolase family 13 protein n=1 Tax=Bacillus sp. FJAT-27916 TaxID=1679169 RepID=UPI00067122B1|nr:alpha-glucosidase [Bacillus sp. FJAT-27916]KMY45390.1 oligo-1,6-glucosidase [Bacillus sp. FJAT-27916]
MKKRWWKEAVCYQIYPKSFMDSNGDGIGDLKGIISKLDYIKDLGIDVIWVCPIYQSPNEDNGYDISDYQDIMDEFGTMEDFDRLLAEVHKRGMKLIMDLVVNHTSDEHPWFIESKSSPDSPKRDWYIWSDGAEDVLPNNWESIFSGSAWEYDKASGQYYLHVFAKKQPDLNWENKEMREEVYRMINWWLDKGIDGFRIDAISHIKKKEGFPNAEADDQSQIPGFSFYTNQEGIHDILQELKERTFSRYDIMTVGEASGVSSENSDPWVNEEIGAFNMVFQFEHLALWEKESETELDLAAYKAIMNKWQTGLHGKGWNALFIENHDKPRIVSTLGDDQKYWKESAKMLGAMYFFMQGTPFIYQGQEIGMTNVSFESIMDYDDISMKNFYYMELAKGRSHEELMKIIWKSGRDNSRTPMQWDSSSNSGFTKGTPWMKVNPNYQEINVRKQEDDPQSILHFYKQMIQLRKQHECLIYGDFKLHLEDDQHIFAYSRNDGKQTALIINNFSREEQAVELPDFAGKEMEMILSNYEKKDRQSNPFLLSPYETVVYLL